MACLLFTYSNYFKSKYIYWIRILEIILVKAFDIISWQLWMIDSSLHAVELTNSTIVIEMSFDRFGGSNLDER